MRKLYLLMITILITVSSFSQSSIFVNPLIDITLKPLNNQLIDSVEYNWSTSYGSKKYFDSHGNVVKYIKKKKTTQGVVTNLYLIQTIYEYDSSNRIVREYSDFTNVPYSGMRYQIYEKLYTYDNAGTHKTTYNEFGEIVWSGIVKYDASGRILSEVGDSLNYGKSLKTRKYHKNNSIEEIHYTFDNTNTKWSATHINGLAENVENEIVEVEYMFRDTVIERPIGNVLRYDTIYNVRSSLSPGGWVYSYRLDSLNLDGTLRSKVWHKENSSYYYDGAFPYSTSHNVITYAYDLDKNIIGEDIVSLNNSTSSHSYKYHLLDADNKKLQTITYDTVGTSLTYSYTDYVYNQSRLIETRKVKFNDVTDKRIDSVIITYDNAGNKTRTVRWALYNNTTSSWNPTYVYTTIHQIPGSNIIKTYNQYGNISHVTDGVSTVNVYYSNTATNIKIHHDNDISVYPNPASSILNIINIIGDYTITISNIHGQIVKSEVTSNTSVDISDLNNGIYLLNIISQSGTYTHKLIKQ